jgi:acetylglutamate kinase
MSDIEGVIIDGTLISTLKQTQAEEFINRGSITGGMIPKVRSAFATLNSGVKKIHIVDGRMKHSLLLEIFTDEGIGTQITPES